MYCGLPRLLGGTLGPRTRPLGSETITGTELFHTFLSACADVSRAFTVHSLAGGWHRCRVERWAGVMKEMMSKKGRPYDVSTSMLGPHFGPDALTLPTGKVGMFA